MVETKKWDELYFKTSRISFVSNYFIAALIIAFTILAINAFDLKFSLFPTSGEIGSSLIIVGLFAIAAILIEQPEWIRFMRQYTITLNEVIEYEGILSKRKIILPYQSISEVTVRRSFFGRLLNYGDIYIGAFRTGSDVNIRGIRNAEKIHEIIQYRINILREGQLTFFKDDKQPKKPKKEDKPKK